MQGLSYGVVRVDTEERLSVLTVQDVGTVTPGGEHPRPQPHPPPQRSSKVKGQELKEKQY